MQEVFIQLSGMTCEKCQKTVNDALCEFAGVKHCQVDLAKQTVHLIGDFSQLNRLDFESLMDELGYQLVEISGLSS